MPRCCDSEPEDLHPWRNSRVQVIVVTTPIHSSTCTITSTTQKVYETDPAREGLIIQTHFYGKWILSTLLQLLGCTKLNRQGRALADLNSLQGCKTQNSAGGRSSRAEVKSRPEEDSGPSSSNSQTGRRVVGPKTKLA